MGLNFPPLIVGNLDGGFGEGFGNNDGGDVLHPPPFEGSSSQSGHPLTTSQFSFLPSSESPQLSLPPKVPSPAITTPLIFTTTIFTSPLETTSSFASTTLSSGSVSRTTTARATSQTQSLEPQATTIYVTIPPQDPLTFPQPTPTGNQLITTINSPIIFVSGTLTFTSELSVPTVDSAAASTANTDGQRKGLIAGVVIVSVFAFLLLIALFVGCRRQRSRDPERAFTPRQLLLDYAGNPTARRAMSQVPPGVFGTRANRSVSPQEEAATQPPRQQPRKKKSAVQLTPLEPEPDEELEPVTSHEFRLGTVSPDYLGPVQTSSTYDLNTALTSGSYDESPKRRHKGGPSSASSSTATLIARSMPPPPTMAPPPPQMSAPPPAARSGLARSGRSKVGNSGRRTSPIIEATTPPSGSVALPALAVPKAGRRNSEDVADLVGYWSPLVDFNNGTFDLEGELASRLRVGTKAGRRRS